MTRALLASPLGLLVGLLLGAFGSGGSIIAVPALVYAAGQTPQDATATSLVLVATAALFGLRTHLRAGRVKAAMGLAFGLSGIGGSFLGTGVNRRLDPDVLLMAFSGLILVAAWRMRTACPTCTRVGEAREIAAAQAGALPVSGMSVRRAVAVLVAGTAVGFLTGLFGVGGGFVIVPALTLVLGFAMPQAIGTSLLVVAVNSATALLARIDSTHVDWSVAVPFAVAAVVGVQFGSLAAGRIDAERSLRLFSGGLVLLAIYTAARAAAALGAG